MWILGLKGLNSVQHPLSSLPKVAVVPLLSFGATLLIIKALKQDSTIHF